MKAHKKKYAMLDLLCTATEIDTKNVFKRYIS